MNFFRVKTRLIGSIIRPFTGTGTGSLRSDGTETTRVLPFLLLPQGKLETCTPGKMLGSQPMDQLPLLVEKNP